MPPSMYLLGMDDAKVVLNVMALLSGLMIAVMSWAVICVVIINGFSAVRRKSSLFWFCVIIQGRSANMC